MRNKFTYQYIKDYIEKFEYILIDKEYIGIKNKLTFADKYGYYYFTSFDNFKQGKTPERFHTLNPFSLNNIKLWVGLNNKKFELISNIYSGNQKLLQWKCFICGEIFNMSWGHIQLDGKCSYCTGQKVGLSNCLATKNPDLSKEWHPTKNGNLTPYEVTYGSGKKVWWECQKCGHEWFASIDSRKNNGCPDCNNSKGELEIKNFLKKNNIIYLPQKTYDRLLGLGNGFLSYDFYLPNDNLLIEYQGIQHEKFCKGVHKTKKDFEKQVEHDRRKSQYAKDNNIELLEIWYYEFNEIEEILSERIKLK